MLKRQLDFFQYLNSDCYEMSADSSKRPKSAMQRSVENKLAQYGSTGRNDSDGEEDQEFDGKIGWFIVFCFIILVVQM